MTFSEESCYTSGMPTQKLTYAEIDHDVQALQTTLQRMRRVGGFTVIQRPGRFLWFQFLTGIIRGLGSAVGAGVILAVLLYVVHKLPFVQRIIDLINNLPTL